jgi:hypothetical protein
LSGFVAASPDDFTRWSPGLHFNKGLAGAPADKIAAARDTAINPAVLDAFDLVLIASGSEHRNPGVPGHKPDLVKGTAEADRNATYARCSIEKLLSANILNSRSQLWTTTGATRFIGQVAWSADCHSAVSQVA